MNQQNKPAIERVCIRCGATRTTRGEPITKKYCSPTCMDEHTHRYDSHGLNAYGRGHMETNYFDDYEGTRKDG